MEIDFNKIIGAVYSEPEEKVDIIQVLLNDIKKELKNVDEKVDKIERKEVRNDNAKQEELE